MPQQRKTGNKIPFPSTHYLFFVCVCAELRIKVFSGDGGVWRWGGGHVLLRVGTCGTSKASDVMHASDVTMQDWYFSLLFIIFLTFVLW